MKVFRGQAKNLKRNIKQNNMKPLVIVFGILVLITLTYTSTHSVMGVGNTMFKEGNGKRRVRRGRQGFEGTTLNAAYRSGFREGSCEADDSCGGFEGGRSGFREDQCDGDDCGVTTDVAFTGGRVSGFEGFSSAKNAAPLHQGFVGRRKQGFKGRMRRRREGSTGTGSGGSGSGSGGSGAVSGGSGSAAAVTTAVSPVVPVSTTRQNTPSTPPPAGGGDSTTQSFVGNRGRRRRR